MRTDAIDAHAKALRRLLLIPEDRSSVLVWFDVAENQISACRSVSGETLISNHRLRVLVPSELFTEDLQNPLLVRGEFTVKISTFGYSIRLLVRYADWIWYAYEEFDGDIRSHLVRVRVDYECQYLPNYLLCHSKSSARTRWVYGEHFNIWIYHSNRRLRVDYDYHTRCSRVLHA